LNVLVDEEDGAAAGSGRHPNVFWFPWPSASLGEQ
jgi:hypothetical protein